MKDSLRHAFKDKDYRHGYVDEFLNARIATQIKVLREQREWTQQELANRAEMMQPRISVMENVNYSSWSINTLRQLAEAFDLVLDVSFKSFGERLNDIDQFGRKNLERPSYEKDPEFTEQEKSNAATKVFPEAQEDRGNGRPNLRLVEGAESAQNPTKQQVVASGGVIVGGSKTTVTSFTPGIGKHESEIEEYPHYRKALA